MFKRESFIKHFLFFLAFIFLFLMVYVGLRSRSFNAFNPSEPVLVAIKKGASLSEISLELKEKGLISNPFIFQMRALLGGVAFKLKPGYYELDKNWSLSDFLYVLSHGLTSPKYDLTIKEGLTLKEIENILKSKNLISPAESFNQWKLKDFKSYLTDLPLEESVLNSSLEGFLFPSTYKVLPGESFYEITASMIDNFRLQVENKLKDQLTKSPHDFYSSLIMASLLEKELTNDQDKRIASGILWKRLGQQMKLQVDATVCYAKSQEFINCQNLTLKDLAINSPYNTYRFKGLPPGPICNPGFSSLLAAFSPEESDYWYYLTDPQTKRAVFSKTLEEHNKAIRKYLKNNF